MRLLALTVPPILAASRFRGRLPPSGAADGTPDVHGSWQTVCQRVPVPG